MNDITKKRAGRPSIQIDWPTNEFTVEDVYTDVSKAKKISKVTIQFKINKALASKELEKVGTVRRFKSGRVAYSYKLVNPQTNTPNVNLP